MATDSAIVAEPEAPSIAAHVDNLVGHGLLDEHFVLRVDRYLRVVADADLRMGGHHPAVGIGQGYLILAGPLELHQ